jgi:hypothetical protein
MKGDEVKVGKAIPYWKNHTEIEGELYKKCSICNKWLSCSEDYFYKTRNKTDGLQPYCIECNKKKAYQWILDHPERHKEHMKKEDSKPSSKERTRRWSEIRREEGLYREWQKSEKGKESMKKSRLKREAKLHEITENELAELYDFCNSRCMYCGSSEKENKEKYNQVLTKDHAINNGSNGIENCILCCKSCSSSKYNLDWHDWYVEDNPHFSLDRYNKITEWLGKSR